MKRGKLVLVMLTIQIFVYSQGCLPEGITFTTQEEIDNFQINYPGCSEIEGSVTINGDDITNLNGLNCITNLGDMLYIGSTNLVNFAGLDSLNSIGGGFWIQMNDSLTTFAGLQNLTYIGDDLLIQENNTIKNFVGLDNLTTIEQDLNIGFNDSLVNLIGLENVSNIGNLYINGNIGLTSLAGLDNLNSNIFRLSIVYNDSLTTLLGLENLTSIVDDLSISGNLNLTSLTGLNNLESVEGTVFMQANNVLTNLSALNNLTTIGGSLSMSFNPGLISISGLHNVTEIGDHLGFWGNQSLLSLEGLENITQVIGGLTIRENNSLENLLGLDNLNAIHGGLNIWDNQNLTDLTGLNNLNSLEGKVEITGNESLISLEGLGEFSPGSVSDLYIYDNGSLSYCAIQSICDYLVSPNGIVEILNNAPGCNNPPEIANNCGISLSCLPYGNYYFFTQNDIDNFQIIYPDCNNLAGEVQIIGDDISSLLGLNEVHSVGGDLKIQHNPSLNNLNGLESLVSVGDYLIVTDNDALESLSGLDNVSTVEGSLYIFSNNALINLTGLENLTMLGNNVYISDNNNLESLIGIENIEAETMSGLSIQHNYSLSTCAIESVCDYLDILWGGVYISDNATGCNSYAEVEEACETIDVPEKSIESEISIYPNPAKITIDISSLPGTEMFNITFYFQTGQKALIINSPAKTIDISNLKPGLYFAEIKTSEGYVMKKIVVQ